MKLTALVRAIRDQLHENQAENAGRAHHHHHRLHPAVEVARGDAATEAVASGLRPRAELLKRTGKETQARSLLANRPNQKPLNLAMTSCVAGAYSAAAAGTLTPSLIIRTPPLLAKKVMLPGCGPPATAQRAQGSTAPGRRMWKPCKNERPVKRLWKRLGCAKQRRR
jgi:hypothetical protein